MKILIKKVFDYNTKSKYSDNRDNSVTAVIEQFVYVLHKVRSGTIPELSSAN